MRLFTAYHNLQNGYACMCFSSVFPAWRVRIMRIDGGCVCDVFKHVDDEWWIVPKTAIPEAQYQRMLADGGCDLVSRSSGWRKVSKERMNEALLDSMLKSDEWRMGEVAELGGQHGKG